MQATLMNPIWVQTDRFYQFCTLANTEGYDDVKNTKRIPISITIKENLEDGSR